MSSVRRRRRRKAFAPAGLVFAPGRVLRPNEAILWSMGWLIVAISVAAGIGPAGGPVGEWATVYLIERSLSLDNVFLFSLLLACFPRPAELRGRVILVGIAGALRPSPERRS
jgi:hypothetical protein